MLIRHGLKSMCIDSTHTVICALGQPLFCFLSLSSSSLLGVVCEDMSDCPALGNTTYCLCRTSSELALLLDIPLRDAFSSLQSCCDSYLKAVPFLTRDIEIKYKLTERKWEEIMGEKGQGCQGTSITDTCTKTKWGRIQNRSWGCLGLGGVAGWKWRHLYLNDKKIK